MSLPSVFLARGRVLLGLALAVLLSVAASPGVASTLRYHYTSNPFQMRVENIRANPGDPNQYSYADVVLYADIDVRDGTILMPGDTLEDVQRFSMTLSVTRDGYRSYETLVYPFEPYCTQCPVEREMEASLTINATGAFTLPTDWDLTISRRFILPTGRHDFLQLSSSESQERISGFYESFTSTTGQLNGARGTWILQVVPEPATYGLMLAGVGLLAWVRRRQAFTP
ncbi:PEP-CTERM sorting domain-containing protein [Mitsuaria sp. GD03876]|uniref:PEP-CTERM sorting domain-containing protein n=1 Tax=Mitsuaria sp. GD03876 TaxID=2975399 RepID=UPI002447CF13|nr:PEP-CTERM sorting domain-containing protein [Mitsuaria sp. GD03876]MDH0868407.1 PEP-CTERM sorting domain-containing protein [Mitsuaria sp. GD03876]